MASFTIWFKEGKIDYVRAEHAPEERLVTPISWATLSVHVVASPGSHGASEVGGLSVHSFAPRAFRMARSSGHANFLLQPQRDVS